MNGEILRTTEIERAVAQALGDAGGARVVVVVVQSSGAPSDAMISALNNRLEQQQRALENVLGELIDIRTEMRVRAGHEPVERPTAAERSEYQPPADLVEFVKQSHVRLKRAARRRVQRGARK